MHAVKTAQALCDASRRQLTGVALQANPPRVRVRPSAYVITVAAAIAFVSVSTFARDALAQRPSVDGVYGRLGGDTVFSIEAGGSIGVHTDGARGGFSVLARARALDMAGLYVGYERAFGATRHDAIVLGVDFRPLMLARIFQDWERGPQWFDLFIDSIGFDLGGAWMRPGDAWRAGSGFAWQFGGGVEFPLVWSRASGMMLRFATRWTHAADWDAQAPGVGVASPEAVTFSLSIVVRGLARLGLLASRQPRVTEQ